MIDRDKYLQNAKTRALALLPNVPDAMASMMSDMLNHDEFRGIASQLSPWGLKIAIDHDEIEARRFIVGFR